MYAIIKRILLVTCALSLSCSKGNNALKSTDSAGSVHASSKGMNLVFDHLIDGADLSLNQQDRLTMATFVRSLPRAEGSVGSGLELKAAAYQAFAGDYKNAHDIIGKARTQWQGEFAGYDSCNAASLTLVIESEVSELIDRTVECMHRGVGSSAQIEFMAKVNEVILTKLSNSCGAGCIDELQKKILSLQNI